MASNRHLGRIIALQTLFEQDFRENSRDIGFDLDAVLSRNILRYETTVDDKAFIERLVHGVAAKAAELDEILQPVAPEWPIAQIARMDRTILRLGLFELLHEKDTPPKVVINEAVELAKAFGSENSSKFVNGVLGTVLRQRDGGEAPAGSKAPVAAPAVVSPDPDDTTTTPDVEAATPTSTPSTVEQPEPESSDAPSKKEE